MKKIFNVIILAWYKIKSKLITIFRNNSHCLSTDTTEQLKKLPHSCALTALSQVMPHLSYDKISEAFYNCCDKWPRAGVRHKEFNIVLRYLHIFDNFIYTDHSKNNITISHFLEKKEVHILLIHGHYTVLYRGKIYDSHRYDNMSGITNIKVYCSWLYYMGK